MTITFDQLSQGVGNNRETVNANFAQARPALSFGLRASPSTGLTLEITGGVIDVDGTPTAVGNFTDTIAANDTTYVYIEADGTIVATISEPSGWPGPLAGSARALLDVTTDDDGRTATNDWRCSLGGATLASILAALDLEDWSRSGDVITITGNGGKSATITLT